MPAVPCDEAYTTHVTTVPRVARALVVVVKDTDREVHRTGALLDSQWVILIMLDVEFGSARKARADVFLCAAMRVAAQVAAACGGRNGVAAPIGAIRRQYRRVRKHTDWQRREWR